VESRLRVLPFVLACSLLISAAAASSMMQASNAPVHIVWVRLPAEGAPEGHRSAVVEFGVGDAAQTGTFSALLTATITRAGEPKPFFTHEEELTFTVSPENAHAGVPLSSVLVPQELAPGAYLFNATLLGHETDAERVWSTYESGEFRIAESRSLESGVGVIQEYEASALDFDGTPGDDLWITSTDNSSEPTANITVRAHRWQTATHQGSGLTGSLSGTRPPGTHEVRVDRAAIMRVFQGLDPARLSATAMEGATWSWDPNGDFVVRFTVGAPPSSDGAVRSTSPGAPAEPQSADVFFDLHHTRSLAPTEPLPEGRVILNISSWSIDEEGYRDVFFYHSAPTNRSDAENLTSDERRETPIELKIALEVNHTESGRELEFRIERLTPPTEAGAWIEFQNATALFRRLLHTNATDPNATPALILHMAPDEGFVQENGTTTWVWIGHFSTQRLTVFLPFKEAQTETSTSPRDGMDRIPSVPVLAVIGVVIAVSLLGRRRR
jgi:hypothetical protein